MIIVNDTLNCIIVSVSCKSDIKLECICIKDSSLQDVSENENRLSSVLVYNTSQLYLPQNLIIVSVFTSVQPII